MSIRFAPLVLALGLFVSATCACAAQPLALAYQDHILQIAVARQQLDAGQADSQLRAFAQQASADDPLNDLRRRLDEAFESWLGAIEQQAATTTAWPAGRSAENWQLLVRTTIEQLREAMLDALVADQDPLPVLQKTAQVAGWTRGEQLSDAPLSGHAQRVSALLAGTPLPPTIKDPEDQQIATPQAQSFHFDQFPLGQLPSEAFASAGVRIKADGVPGLYAADASMVLPAGRSQVLLIAGQRTTALTFVFDPPIRRFSLTRIGTAGGSSTPTWTLRAFDRAGAVVGSTGEDFGLPAQPQQFSVNGAGIVRVVLDTDNRYGEGTRATWNSLPVAEFEVQR